MEANSPTRHIVITSVGAARPASVVAVAHGLGLPIDRTLQAIYRAPALLVSGVQPALAERLSAVLEQVGLRTRIEDSLPSLPPAPLFDVAVHLVDPGRAWEVAAALAGFCACDAERALTLLTTPPGVVLGGVGRSAVEALERALPEGAAELVASDPSAARYVLIHAGQSATALDRLRRTLDDRGIATPPGSGLLADDLSFADARAIWESFGRTGAVRIVNRDFLRFEIWIEGRTGTADDEARAAALHTRAGVPEEMAQELLEAGGAVLEGGVRYADLEARMQGYAAAGVGVRAELTTFQAVGVEVVAARDPGRLEAAARGLGLQGPLVPPFHTPPMPEAQARITRAVLEAAGAEAYFAEPAHA